MNKESIIREWFYRLPNGYATAPYSKKEMNVLHEVLAENGINGSIFVNEVDQLDQAFHNAEPVDEASKKPPADWEKELPEFENGAREAGVLPQYQAFKASIANAGPDPEKATIDVLNKMSDSQQQTFFEGFKNQKQAPTKSFTVSGEVDMLLFKIKASGIGRAEVYCVWKYGGQIQGGNVSFDIAMGGSKYEVKDYSTEKSAPIRVGAEGSVSKHPVWDRILLTVRMIKRMEDNKLWELLPAQDTEAYKNVIEAKNYILERIQYYNALKDGPQKGNAEYAEKETSPKIVTGEFSGTDTNTFETLYINLDTLFKSEENTFNQLIAQGPNQKPMSLIIDPEDLSNISAGDSITVSVKSVNTPQIESIANYWKKLDYISSIADEARNPLQFRKDLEFAVQSIIKDGTADYWMIARPDIIKIIPKERAPEFKYYAISQNGLKFTEPGVTLDDETPIESEQG